MKNKRTLAAIFWLVAVVVMLLVMPDLDKLVQEKGQVTLPNDLESVIGTDILNDMTNDYLNNTSNTRKVIDYLAGMTDDYFINRYNEVSNIKIQR